MANPTNCQKALPGSFAIAATSGTSTAKPTPMATPNPPRCARWNWCRRSSSLCRTPLSPRPSSSRSAAYSSQTATNIAAVTVQGSATPAHRATNHVHTAATVGASSDSRCHLTKPRFSHASTPLHRVPSERLRVPAPCRPSASALTPESTCISNKRTILLVGRLHTRRRNSARANSSSTTLPQRSRRSVCRLAGPWLSLRV